MTRRNDEYGVVARLQSKESYGDDAGDGEGYDFE